METFSEQLDLCEKNKQKQTNIFSILPGQAAKN